MAESRKQHKKNNKSWFTPKKKTYEFEGVNLKNEEVKGQVEAKDEKDARRQLLYRHIKIKKIKVVRKKFSRKIRNKDITIFTRQLAAMLKAGIPIVQSLDIIAKGASKETLNILLQDIRNRLEQGSSLTEALQAYPKYFDALYCGLVHSGETSGLLDATLERIALQREKNARLKGNVIRAMVYPFVVIVISLAVIIFMLIWVIPIFKELYQSMNVELPWLTRKVLAVSDFFTSWIGISLVLVLIALGVFCVKTFKTNDLFREKVTRWILKIPLLGSLLIKSEVAKWSRTFGSLYGAGLPMPETLALISNETKNILYKKVSSQIQVQVSQGENLGSCVGYHEDLFPPIFVQLIEVGEESGTLEEMMNKSADYFDEEVDTQVSVIQTLLEPIVIVVLGVVVGILLISMYMPLFDMSANI